MEKKSDVHDEKTEKSEVVKQYLEISVTPEKRIKAEIVSVLLSRLKLDPDNVRFRHLFRKLSDEDMEKEIADEEDTKNLCGEIEYSKGLTDPPVIDSDYVVREGSRRIVCCRALLKKYKGTPDENKYSNVQCVMLPKDTKPEDIALYLARAHVSGKKKWASFNKAAHISELYNRYKMTYEDIRKALSMGKSTVIRMIFAYKAEMKYAELYEKKDTGWLYKYSYFDEWFKPRLKQWNTSNEFTMKFMEWLKDEKITQGMQVRKLPEILNDPDALAVLDSPQGNFDKAMKVISEKKPAIGSDFYSLMDRTQRVLTMMSREEMFSTASSTAKLQILKNLERTLGEVIREIDNLRRKGK